MGTVLFLPACSSRLGAPRSGTEEGEAVLDLWRIMFWTAAALGAVVLGLIAWCVLRYRKRGPDDGALPTQTRGHVRTEVVYTAVPFALVVVLFGLSLATDAKTTRVRDASNFDVLDIDVTGFQWQWRFEYRGEDVAVEGGPGALPVLMLPAGRVVHLRLRTTDVIHSFFVPGFLTKRDLIPGVDSEIEIRPVRTGTYSGNCAEFCGLDHSRMNFDVRVVSSGAFDAWLARQHQVSARPDAPISSGADS